MVGSGVDTKLNKTPDPEDEEKIHKDAVKCHRGRASVCTWRMSHGEEELILALGQRRSCS